MKLSLIGSALILFASLGTAKAQNLLVNGDFSAGGGSLNNWTVQYAAQNSYLVVGSDIGTSGAPYLGYAAEFGAEGPALDYIEQSFTSTPGDTYQLTFLLLTYTDPDDVEPNDFQANLGGMLNPTSITNGTTLDIPNTNTDQFNQFTVNFMATSDSTTVIFGGFNGSDTFNDLAAVSVEEVPEPSTYALLLGGLGLLAFWRRRTRRAAIC